MALDNFVLQNTNPLEAYLQGAGGIQTLQNNQQIMDARVAAQQQAVQQQQAAQAAALQKQQALNDLYNTTDPLLLAKKTAAYVRANPDEWQGVAASSKILSDAQRKSVQGITAQVTSAVASGRPELGQQAIDGYVQSLENSGAPDDQIAGAKYFQKQFSHDPKAAVMSMNLGSMALDPDSYVTNNKVAADTAAATGQEARNQQMQPLEVAAKQATTEKTRAETAAELQKMGLTAAQIAKTQVEAEKQLQAAKELADAASGRKTAASGKRTAASGRGDTMSEKIIRWGILGTGKIARTFASALCDLPGAQLAAVASRSSATANQFGAEFNIAHRHASYQALADDPDVDVIYIATPHTLHADNAIMCLQAGKHVLCEKAFTMNRRQAQEVIDLERSKKLFLMEAMWTRFLPAIVEATRIIASGEIGTVRHIQ